MLGTKTFGPGERRGISRIGLVGSSFTHIQLNIGIRALVCEYDGQEFLYITTGLH